MAEVQVQVIRIQAFEGRVDRLRNVFAGEAASVGTLHRGPKDFAGNDQALTGDVFDSLAHDNFRLAAGVDVGVVEEIYALVESCVDQLVGSFFIDLRAHGHPSAKGYLTDLEARAS